MKTNSLVMSLINSGINPGMDVRFSKKIKITNQISLALSVIATCYIFIFCLTGYMAQGLWLIVPVCALWLPPILNGRKLYTLARLCVYITVVVTVYIYASMFGKGTGIYLVFIPCTCLPWIYFELKEWKYIVACVAVSVACFFVYSISDSRPTIVMAPVTETIISVTISIAVFTYIYLCMQFLTMQNSKSEQYLADMYTRFFEDIPTPMWIFDVNTRQFLAINQNAVKNYGYSKEEFLSMNIADILPTEQKANHDKAIQSAVTANTFDCGYILHRKKNGEVFYAHILTNSTVYNDVPAMVVQAIDVNDKVLTEQKLEELRIAQEQLKIREEDLKETIKQKNIINRQLEKFNSIVAHDIKSPLMGITTILSALQKDPVIKGDEDMENMVHGLTTTCSRLSDMVISILEYSKKSEQEQEDTHVDVNDLVVEVKDMLDPQKNIDFKIETPLPRLKTKKIKLLQVFQNLLSNAIKYNDKEKSKIAIGHEDDGIFYKFYVKDNGPGIKEKDTARIFYLFHTSENTPYNNDTSTGVGLNILKMLVEEQGGEISVKSEPAIGSCFYFQWRK